MIKINRDRVRMQGISEYKSKFYKKIGENMSKSQIISGICVLLAFILLIAVNGVSKTSSSDQLTPEQCKSFKESGSFVLTKEQEAPVEESCKKRYSSGNALDNCIFYEKEDKKVALKDIAKKQCK